LAGRYLRDAVYGATDGTVTTFAVVSGVEGAGLPGRIVLILGVANLVGDGFSMAAGNYLATKADRERDETNDPDAAGASHASDPLRAAGVTFVAFAIAGAVPLLPYATGLAGNAAAWVSAGLTAATFFAIGAGKTLVVRTRWWLAGTESLAIGGAAAALAYLCGNLLARLT
jgi:VIT1/CCC1 family predicted Fe2+/Mn2+ transporter